MQGVASLRHLCPVGATLGTDAPRFGLAGVRSRTALAAKPLSLRTQLARPQEREVPPPRPRGDPPGAALAGLRSFPWREAILIGQPAAAAPLASPTVRRSRPKRTWGTRRRVASLRGRTRQQCRKLVAMPPPSPFVPQEDDSLDAPGPDAAVTAMDVRVLWTPIQALLGNAYCERLLATVRWLTLDHNSRGRAHAVTATICRDRCRRKVTVTLQLTGARGHVRVHLRVRASALS